MRDAVGARAAAALFFSAAQLPTIADASGNKTLAKLSI